MGGHGEMERVLTPLLHACRHSTPVAPFLPVSGRVFWPLRGRRKPVSVGGRSRRAPLDTRATTRRGHGEGRKAYAVGETTG
jgi:hypothetical protein